MDHEDKMEARIRTLETTVQMLMKLLGWKTWSDGQDTRVEIKLSDHRIVRRAGRDEDEASRDFLEVDGG